MISIGSNNQYSIITVNKYNEHQDSESYKVATKEQPSNNQVTAEEQPRNTTNTWFKNQVDRAMLEEETDFIQISEQTPKGSTGGRPSIDYALTLSSAKEISMLNGGEKGMSSKNFTKS